MTENDLNKVKGIIRNSLVTIFAVLFSLVLFFSAWFTSDEGYVYFVQDTLFSSSRVITEPGLVFKVPFFTRVSTYKQSATISFGVETAQSEFTRNLPPLSVTFADTYNATVITTFRFRLPTDPEAFRKIHGDFRSFENLVDTLLVQESRNVGIVTGTQFTGEEFLQGGVNAYKTMLEDQLANGVYRTQRQQVEIETIDIAAVSSDNSNPNVLEAQKQKVWKNVILTDSEGNPLRQNRPLSEYGVQIVSVSIGNVDADHRLDDLLERKRKSVSNRIAAVEEQATAREEAKTAQLQAEIEKRRAVQIAQKELELAEIAKQKEVEVERRQADLERIRKEKEQQIALIEKKKQLEVAVAERDIQAANAEAAKFEAQAIREKGFAEADVSQRQLEAKQAASDVYMAELALETARIIYPNLKDFKVTMPQVFIGGGNSTGEAPNSLDTFLKLGIMEQAKKATENPSTVNR